MAEIVAVYAVPHTPSFVVEVQLEGERSETAQFFSKIRSHLEASKPDLILTVNNDHFNTFFFDNWPTYAIGTAERTAGPNDQTPGMPWYELTVDGAAARYILRFLIEDGFDFTSSLEFEIDHGALVPLHFMTPAMELPIVPIFINCVVPPLPSAARCYALGRSIAKAIRSLKTASRVAIVASGSLSLEIGGPRADLGKTFGVPDPAWARWILERIQSCEHGELIEAASEARMLEAGNVGGELLNWIVALGIIGPSVPTLLINQPELGNAFAAWSVEGEGS
ncbi:MAG: catalytic LigB subunit of aromatic ring-opening dioxygenase family protein [Bradyrhizobium sp.]|nr:catalytic LigB subunit of aromatic ring-opening dioxygenase family protein [Bradyrhizobium sp.]